ncbi:unnamed protein product, partial [Prunus brigantina]
SSALVPHTFNQARSEMKCVKYIIKDEIPFRAVEGTGFREFINDLQPRFIIPNRKKVAKGVWDLFLVEKTKIMSVISDERVSITTDIWTSIQNINYMVVTAHFMDYEWKLHKRIINFIKITSHKGDDIGRCLDACLNSWGIKKVFSITVDNASANDGAVEYMAKRFKSLNTLMLEGKYLHMRCACHILNLVVKDGLKELSSSIEGIRNCVKYIHSSPSRLDKFRDFAILESMDNMANIPLDVATSALLTLYNEYKGVGNLGPLQTLDEGDEEGLEDELDGDDAHSQMLREMLLQRKEEQQMEISNEVDKYFADPFENPRNKSFNLLDWWKGNQSRYPILSKVAKDIFAIPSSTVASENAFSLGKRIVDPFRSSLTPKMVEALVCTHDWLRADEFNLYKEPTDEEIAFYKELEEIQAMATNAQGGNAQVSTSTSILPPPTPSYS